MDLSNLPVPISAVRHDGWTAARRTQFLDRPAQDGNVLAACAHVGMSREAAHCLRRRDALFARAWAAAQALAREASAQVLGTRALDGVEEEVWYRGEVVGTRRRYDNRLLLACVAGAAIPEEIAVDDEPLPIDRATCALMHAELARDEAPEAERDEAYARGQAEGEALWDAWHVGVCDAVDRLLAEPLETGLRTVSGLSGVSTSGRPDAP